MVLMICYLLFLEISLFVAKNDKNIPNIKIKLYWKFDGQGWQPFQLGKSYIRSINHGIFSTWYLHSSGIKIDCNKKNIINEIIIPGMERKKITIILFVLDKISNFKPEALPYWTFSQ